MKKVLFISLLLITNFVFSQGGYSPISKLRLTSTPTESNSNTQVLVRDGSSGNVNYVQKDSLVGDLDSVLAKGNESTLGMSIGGVGINTTTPEAVLDVVSTESGVLIPRLTTVQRDAISAPINSMLIFNSDSEIFEFYFDSVWYGVGFQDLQSVTDIGSTTSNDITIDDGAEFTYVGKSEIVLDGDGTNTFKAQMFADQISFSNNSTGDAFIAYSNGSFELKNNSNSGLIKSELLTNSRELQLPDSSGTIATEEWVNTSSLPLTGTNPSGGIIMDGNVQFDGTANANIFVESGVLNFGVRTNQDISYLSYDTSSGGLQVNVDNLITSKGLDGEVYFGANYTDNTYVQKKYVDNITGWQQITDATYTSGSPLTIATGVTGKILTGTVSEITTQLPDGVTTFWNNTTDKLVGVNNGDAFTLSLRFKAKMDVANGIADVGIDIGGALNVISSETLLFSKGSGVEQRFDIDLSYFTGSTFIANGGDIEITPINGNIEIYDIVLVPIRTHKGK